MEVVEFANKIRKVREAVQERLKREYEAKRTGKPTDALKYLRFYETAVKLVNNRTNETIEKNVYILGNKPEEKPDWMEMRLN